MTGYTVHTGSSEGFASGWDRIFGEKKKAKPEKQKSPKAKAKSPAKKAKKK
jgi:hypothetical protein